VDKGNRSRDAALELGAGVLFVGIGAVAVLFATALVALVFIPAGFYLIAAYVFAWWPARDQSLASRTLRVANHVLDTSPGGWRLPDLKPPSPLGTQVDMAAFIREYEERPSLRKRLTSRRRYSDRLHRKVGSIIEELATRGAASVYQLQPYITRVPEPSERHDLAAKLAYVAGRLSNSDGLRA
jgi:hypothetical protein